MGEFMRQQVSTARRSRVIRAFGEEDVIADGECGRRHPVSEAIGGVIVMDACSRHVGAERVPESLTYPRIERLAASGKRGDLSRRLRIQFTAGQSDRAFRRASRPSHSTIGPSSGRPGMRTMRAMDVCPEQRRYRPGRNPIGFDFGSISGGADHQRVGPPFADRLTQFVGFVLQGALMFVRFAQL
jgi:hypothetical protein